MKKHLLIFLPFLLLCQSVHAYEETELSRRSLKEEVVKAVEGKRELLISTSNAIWEYAEVAFKEHKSSKLLMDTIENQGFQVKRGISGMPTAFLATYGSGKPVIGILAEYDALPGLSQENLPYKKSLVEAGAGHGCGHNLFAAGSLGASLALKEVIERNNLTGTIRLYGCPAEEAGGGKLYMARDNLFDDLDVCLAWHPWSINMAAAESSQAIDGMEIEFFGKTAHAAADPWKGRSSLDALEMTTFGINLLREHIKPSVRLHYVIRNGGEAPNVVPDYANLEIWVRDSTREGVKTVVERVKKIAEGAAIATGTTSKVNNQGGLYELLVNLAGARVMQQNLEMLGSIEYSGEEIAYSKKIQKEAGVQELGLAGGIQKLREPSREPQGGSTDVADVSWITPVIQVITTCTPLGVPGHSWATVTSSRHSIGHKGMLLAAKAMAATAVDLLLEKKILIEIKKEFEERRHGQIYETGLPAGMKPPVH
ncbi:amidohydrolase [Acidobacteriota bacterium]